jgi:hypothetical protein
MSISLALCLLIPVKFGLFYALFSMLRLRARTSYLSSLVLSNYSEFGLIVGALAVGIGALSQEWLVILAISTSISFVITSVAYRTSHRQYTHFKTKLKTLEKSRRLKEDIYPVMHDAEFLVIGMGRVGKGAFHSLAKLSKSHVWGMDADREKVKSMQASGHNVILGDGEDIDLWENLDISGVKLVLLALPAIEDAVNISRELRNANYTGKVAAVARYQDEVDTLLDQGIDKVFNFFTDAGLGFAEESIAYIDETQTA